MSTASHVAANRAAWDGWAAGYEAAGRANWAADEPRWGIFGVPESTLGLLPSDPSGLDAVELGCGTGYVSSWLARRGARPVGLDNSRAQLETARLLQAEFGLEFPLVHADAEAVPLAGGRFDFAISEYGASIWCDPYRWIPEAARLLRPGGRLVFLVNSPLLACCVPDAEGAKAGDRLVRPYLGLRSIEWSDDHSVEFHLGHGAMFRLLTDTGFEVEDLAEVEVPAGATTTYDYVPVEWARKWPCEEVWKVRLAS